MNMDRGYDASLVEEEALAAAGLEAEMVAQPTVATLDSAGKEVAVQPVAAASAAPADQKEINVLVLCAGAGTSAMLANALK